MEDFEIQRIQRYILTTIEEVPGPITNSPCWIWQMSVNSWGYGNARWDDQWISAAHRLAYLGFVGPIPAGMQLNHRCDQRDCVSHTHLRPGTQQDNVDEMWARGRRKRQRQRSFRRF
jgi:hypothetical protein